jgi:MFS family permease
MPERLRRHELIWVRLAVALAFADASIVVLALPQIVIRLHTSIGASVWVIVAYNLALIVGSVAIIVLRRRPASRRALVAGLILFGVASLGCGAAGSLGMLVPLRCLQGLGGALVLSASLPLFTAATRPEASPLYAWSAAAALGAAIGPAVGGVLTQVFDWRAIFFAQAPVAAVAAFAAVTARTGGEEQAAETPPPPRLRRTLDPLSANTALAFLSAGLIGALFLVVVELINGWLVSPIGAAAIVTTLPVATAICQRATPGRSPFVLGAAGSVLLAAGLLVLAGVSHRALGPVVAALALCGAGLGLGFHGLTAAALAGPDAATVRAARTTAARDAGLVLGLLVLTPVFVHELNAAPDRATKQAAGVVIIAPLPTAMKFDLASRLQSVVARTPESEVPDIRPVFGGVAAEATPTDRAHLAALEVQLHAIIERAVTHAFRRPYTYAALFSLLVLPLLALRLAWVRWWSPSAGNRNGEQATGRPRAGTPRRRRSSR